MAGRGIASTGISWPATLPQSPLRDGYLVEVGAQYAASEIEDGPPRWRRVRQSNFYNISVGYILTAGQLADLADFCQTDLDGGTSAWDMPLEIHGAVRNVVVHLAEPYSYWLVGQEPASGLPTWQVSMRLTAWDRYVAPPAADVYRAGSPAILATNIVVAGSPAAPASPDTIILALGSI